MLRNILAAALFSCLTALRFSTPRSFLPTLQAHNQYLKKASQYANDPSKISLLALQFQQEDNEKAIEKERVINEKERVMKDKDFEKVLALALKDKETEKVLAIKDKETEKLLAIKEKDTEKVLALKDKDNEMSLLKSSLGALSQRYVLERFLADVVEIVAGDQVLADAIQSVPVASPYFLKVFKQDKGTKVYSSQKDPKMTDINKILCIAEARKAIWGKLNIPENVEFPIFPNEVLYGRLSDPTHLPPNLKAIFISNKVDPAYKQFFIFIVSDYKLQVEEYSEEEAAAAAEKHNL